MQKAPILSRLDWQRESLLSERILTNNAKDNAKELSITPYQEEVPIQDVTSRTQFYTHIFRLNDAYKEFREASIDQQYPQLKVAFYGSSQNKFWLNTSSDLDCCFVQDEPYFDDLLDNQDFRKRQRSVDKMMIVSEINNFETTLLGQNFRGKKKIRVNKIKASNLSFLECQTQFKFDGVSQQLEFDVNVKSDLGLFNTELLKTYADLNKKFHRVGCFLKYWNKMAIRKKHKNQDVDNTNSLSSYAILMMLLVFLQSKYNLLPPLQKIYFDGTISYNNEEGRPQQLHRVIDQRNKKIKSMPDYQAFHANVYFVKDLEIARRHCFSSEDDDDIPIKKILAEFFYFYAFVFDSSMIINSVTGRFQKKEKSISQIYAGPFAIIDPFDLNHNPGKLLRQNTMSHKCTIEEFIDSFYRIIENRPIFDDQ